MQDATAASAKRFLSYRPDVDGLRAIAVAIVVAFHVGLPGFSGGFVGVDIFFVISGFLITGLLLDELRRSGTISFSRFYARRVRRLLPALLLVIATTLLLGGLVLLSVTGEQQDLAKSALATVLSVSNFYFWSAIRYFSVHSDLMPLLHTWSLSVEEQFYMVWPALLLTLLVVLAKRDFGAYLRRLPMVLLTLAVVSFAANLWLTANARNAAFYLMPARAWEFALGGLITLAAPSLSEMSGRLRIVVFGAGMTAIVLATCLLDADTSFPGVAVLLPTLGAAAVIAAGCGTSRGILATAPMVRLGLLSYSWYLWHWPLLSLARVLDLGQRSVLRDTMIALLALGAAWLTFRFVEEPVRSQRVKLFGDTRRSLLVGATLSLAVVFCAMTLGWMARYSNSHVVGRWAKSVADARGDLPVPTAQCMPEQYTHFAGFAYDSCATLPKQSVRIALWGDSHANQLYPLMNKESQAIHVNIREYARASCPPLLGVMPYHNGMANHECARFNAAVIGDLEHLAGQGLEGVVIAARWTGYVGLGQPNPALGPAASLSYGDTVLSPEESLRALQIGLTATVNRLRRAGLRVLIVGQIPELYYSVPECLLRRSAQECAMERQRVNDRREAAMTVLRSELVPDRSVRLLDPIDALCDTRSCYPVRGGVVMYSDSHHLTATGVETLAPQFDPELIWLAAHHPHGVHALHVPGHGPR